jgi:hypothetical protein
MKQVAVSWVLSLALAAAFAATGCRDSAAKNPSSDVDETRAVLTVERANDALIARFDSRLHHIELRSTAQRPNDSPRMEVLVNGITIDKTQVSTLPPAARDELREMARALEVNLLVNGWLAGHERATPRLLQDMVSSSSTRLARQ